MEVIYRELEYTELDLNLFSAFVRKQVVTDCWSKTDGRCEIKSYPFIEYWGKTDYYLLIKSLKATINNNGAVYGAFIEGMLKGFSSVEGKLFGTKNRYIDLTHIYVSKDVRGRGIGKKLFELAKERAKKSGAEKLYISAHSAVETQAFYYAMGCAEALEYSKFHTQKEPYDCQLECILY